MRASLWWYSVGCIYSCRVDIYVKVTTWKHGTKTCLQAWHGSILHYSKECVEALRDLPMENMCLLPCVESLSGVVVVRRRVLRVGGGIR